VVLGLVLTFNDLTKKMKLITTLFLFQLLSISCYSQDVDKKVTYVGLNYSNTLSEAFTYRSLDGGGSFDGGRIHIYGISYLRKLNQSWDFETGLEFFKQNFKYSADLPPDGNSLINEITRNEDVHLLSIPILFRLKFLKFFFLQMGSTFDMDFSGKENLAEQTGLGLNLGLGFNYDFKFGASAFVVPYLESHALIEFNDGYTEHITEAGIRYGLLYRLK